MSSALEFPRMLYGEGGQTLTVKNAEEQSKAGKGWSTSPSDEHRTPPVQHAPQRSGDEPFIEAIAKRTAELVLAALNTPPPPKPAPAPKPASDAKN